jgi:hypothetical protein
MFSCISSLGCGKRGSEALSFADVKKKGQELALLNSKFSDDAKAPPAMEDLTKAGSMSTIDGLIFSALMVSGYTLVAKNKDELNKINVFPIPDADTGNNMKIALRGGALRALFEPESSLQEAADTLARDALLNGQGNSGTVLSHFFVKLSKELESLGGNAKVSVSDFATCLTKAGNDIASAFAADKVKEGTIVSVVRKGVQFDGTHDSLAALLTEWEAKTKTALYQTPDELIVIEDGKEVHVLKRANVDCDSGAKGFYYMVLGMLQATKEAVDLDGVLGRDIVDGIDGIKQTEEISDSEKHQYCTECVIELKEGSTSEQLEELLADPELGDSMVLTSMESKGKTVVKAHIHSDAPQKVFDCCQQHNRMQIPLKEKSDDMRRQVANSHRSYNPDNFKVSFVFDSSCLTEEWSETGFVIAPILGMIKGEPFPMTFDPPGFGNTEFMNKSRHEEMKVGTAAPPVEVFRQLFEAAIPLGKPIICVALSSLLSRTHQNAVDAVELLPEQHRSMITIIDHGYMTGSGMAMGSALLKAAARGASKEDLLKLADDVANNVFQVSFLNTTSFCRLAAHGRMGDAAKAMAASLTAKGTKDDELCMPIGTPPGNRDPYPATPADKAGCMKNPVLLPTHTETKGMLLGPGSDMKAFDEYLSIVKTHMKPGEKLCDVHVGNVSSRMDVTNSLIVKVKDVLGEFIEGDVEVLQPFLASCIIAAWGSFSICFWIKRDTAKYSYAV